MSESPVVRETCQSMWTCHQWMSKALELAQWMPISTSGQLPCSKRTFACSTSSLGAPDALCLGLILLGAKTSHQVVHLQGLNI